MDKNLTISEQKAQLRAEKFSALLSVKDRILREKIMTEKVLSFIKNNGYKKVAIYNSVRTELSTKDVINALLDLKIDVFIPVVTTDKEMVFFVNYPEHRVQKRRVWDTRTYRIIPRK